MILLILIFLLLFGGIGAGPWWGHSSTWGYGPSGILGVLLVIGIVLWLTGHRF